jgi:hypothetical protein
MRDNMKYAGATSDNAKGLTSASGKTFGNGSLLLVGDDGKVRGGGAPETNCSRSWLEMVLLLGRQIVDHVSKIIIGTWY